MADEFKSLTNAHFEAYYGRLLGEELDLFLDCCRSPLPASFRMNRAAPNIDSFIESLKAMAQVQRKAANSSENNPQIKIRGKEAADADGEDEVAFRQVPISPLMFTLNVSRQGLKGSKTLEQLHRAIQQANDCGLLTRQEVVSALPVTLLDIRPTDLILDLCSAPGSKTSQLLEALALSSEGGSRLVEGGVVANELDNQRAWMLVHQLKRVGMSGVTVVNHAGQSLPMLVDPKSANPYDKKVYFDKVLADVPCSGDGAIRKIPNRWSQWSTKEALNIHTTQISLLVKAIQLAKVGGEVVYSTCSINPVENEAVVAEVLKRGNDLCPGAITIQDCRGQIKEFKTRPGLESWPVMLERPISKKLLDMNDHAPDDWSSLFTEYHSYEDVIQEKIKGIPGTTH